MVRAAATRPLHPLPRIRIQWSLSRDGAGDAFPVAYHSTWAICPGEARLPSDAAQYYITTHDMLCVELEVPGAFAAIHRIITTHNDLCMVSEA